MPSFLLKLSYPLEYYENDLMKVCVWLLNTHSPPLLNRVSFFRFEPKYRISIFIRIRV